MSARGSVAGIATASGKDGSVPGWERRSLSCRGPGSPREESTSSGKAGSSSVISGVLDRWIVLCWGVTSAEQTGGELGGPFPLLRGAPLSKSAISRIVGRLQALFTDWRQRLLKEKTVVFVYLDAIALRVRIAAKVISAPVFGGTGGESGRAEGGVGLGAFAERVE